MKNSLKQILYTHIKEKHGQMVSINEVERISKMFQYKQSNAERRLRELCSTPDADISPVLEPKGRYIIGYQWKDKDMLF